MAEGGRGRAALGRSRALAARLADQTEDSKPGEPRQMSDFLRKILGQDGDSQPDVSLRPVGRSVALRNRVLGEPGIRAPTDEREKMNVGVTGDQESRPVATGRGHPPPGRGTQPDWQPSQGRGHVREITPGLTGEMERLDLGATGGPESGSSIETGRGRPSPERGNQSDRQPSGRPVAQEPIVMRGTGGTPVTLSTNHFRLKKLCPDAGMYEYEVKYNPPQDAKRVKSKLLQQAIEIIGPTRNFDGVKLFLPKVLTDKVTVFTGQHPYTEEPVKLNIIFKQKTSENDAVQFYNILFRRIMNILEYTEINRSFYKRDEYHKIKIPQHKLELWPGYITSVQEDEGGLFLMADASFRVLRMQAVSEILADCYRRDRANYRDEAVRVLLGAIVLTEYNAKTYRIDEIDWNLTPLSTFERSDGSKITYVDYYLQHYNLKVKDVTQPLLISRAKKKMQGEESVTRLICLLPEFCNMTGLTDDMRSDFRVMKDLASHTRITPQQRRATLLKYINSVKANPEACGILKQWGLELDSSLLQLQGRCLNPISLNVQGGTIQVNQQADWGRDVTGKGVLRAADLEKWLVVHTNRSKQATEQFVQTVFKCCGRLGMTVARPQIIELRSESTDAYVTCLRQQINPSTQLVVTIMSTSRDDRYNAVKRICCIEKPVASQVINMKTISDPRKLNSVTQKVLLQINCKLGGELWGVSLPKKDGLFMVCGIDAYHDSSRKGKSVLGFVASMNDQCSRWYSQARFQCPNQEMGDTLNRCLGDALDRYTRTNRQLPSLIFIFRDGVGDGQLQAVMKHEIPQMQQCYGHLERGKDRPRLAFVIVQKRISTRLMLVDRALNLENPPPGTVLDHTVTRYSYYDFYLVSQHVRQGTVNPSHYVVIHDEIGLPPGSMQGLSYKLTHMYFNWPGTIRVPAPCQYAHKLAQLVGQNLHKEHNSVLSERLFYL